MISLFGKKNKDQAKDGASAALTWSDDATQALQQATSGAPVPKMLKKRLEKELTKAAEDKARSRGSSEVSANDLMEGLLAKLPAEMKNQVMQAAQKGPKGLEELQRKFQKKG